MKFQLSREDLLDLFQSVEWRAVCDQIRQEREDVLKRLVNYQSSDIRELGCLQGAARAYDYILSERFEADMLRSTDA